MSEYVIVTDATADLPQTVVEQYGIQVIPMAFDLDEVVYHHYPDARELPLDLFYQKLSQGSVSHSSQIPPIVYHDFFQPILEQGKDILYLGLSSGLSSTCHNAVLVAGEMEEKYPGRRICAIDSLCASIGEGILVLNAALQQQAGKTLDELQAWVLAHRQSARHWFTVQDLFYLKRGGRLSTMEAMLGTALRIRPVLSVDTEGKLFVQAKVRGAKKELDYLLSKLEAEGIDAAEQTVIVGHTSNAEAAQGLAEILMERGLVKEVIVSGIGPIIGTHVGPGMLALTFMGKAE